MKMLMKRLLRWKDGSDAGSDIFMPGGITMKAAELPQDHSENSDAEEATSPKKQEDDVVNMSIDDEEKSQGKMQGKSPEVTVESMESKNNNIDDDKSIGSPSSCLEINIDDESAFPRSQKEKSINMKDDETKEENYEERNIFMNSDLFDKTKEESDSKGEQQTDDDEHNMSDDFKIGLNQKSYEGDPFCPDKPRAFETIEKNAYLIDKYVFLSCKYFSFLFVEMISDLTYVKIELRFNKFLITDR